MENNVQWRNIMEHQTNSCFTDYSCKDFITVLSGKSPVPGGGGAAALAGAIGIALCCGLGALPHNGTDTEFGRYPPTPPQIDAAGKLVAALAQGLAIPIDRWNVLTHCEAALIDGYGPYSGDAETRWDLWYLRDSPGDGLMKPGGQVIRGKAMWYAKSSPLV